MEPIVSIIMGSTSDLPVMEKAAKYLDDMQIPFEMHALSAHRTPAEVEKFARGAKARGIKVIIAAAGMAAHLPGVIAAMTTVPVIGVGFDASALYVHRTVNFENTEGYNELTEEQRDALGRDYIDIPINLKYKLSLPGIGSVVKPFVTTGPSFAFLVSKKEVNDFVKNKSCDISWNFGFGVELFSHVQVAASYGLGLNNTIEFFGDYEGKNIEGKNRYWTVTAAYLF